MTSFCFSKKFIIFVRSLNKWKHICKQATKKNVFYTITLIIKKLWQIWI